MGDRGFVRLQITGEVIRYGDIQESVEEILGMETTFWSYDEHHVQYTDETEAFYRETDRGFCLAYFQIVDSSYITYQGAGLVISGKRSEKN